MIKQLLSLAAVAALAFSANADNLQFSAGYNVNVPLIGVKMTATSGWGEYKLATSVDLSSYKGYRVEYSNLTGSWQIKIEDGSSNSQYNELSATATSIANDFSSSLTGTLNHVEIQAKEANATIVVDKVFLIKSDGSEQQVTVGSPNWGINLAPSNPFAPTLIFVGQWGTASILNAEGGAVTYNQGGDPLTFEINFAQATPISFVVDFDAVAYWNIPAGTTTATYTVNDAVLGEKTAITKAELKADSSDTSNNEVTITSMTVTKAAAGVDNVAVESNAPVEYFNLQGIRVENPENGLFIRRQGNVVSKVLVK